MADKRKGRVITAQDAKGRINVVLQSDVMTLLTLYIFGLLRGPLLNMKLLADDRLAVESLLGTCTPNDFIKLAYPELFEITSLDVTEEQGRPLRCTRDSLSSRQSSKPCLLVLDALTTVCVYYPWETLQPSNYGNLPTPTGVQPDGMPLLPPWLLPGSSCSCWIRAWPSLAHIDSF